MKEKKVKKVKIKDEYLLSEIKSICIFYVLFFLAVVLIHIGICMKDSTCQNLFLGLGTGATTSALVSLVFYLNDKEIKKRERLKARKTFMEDFKILFHNIVYSIDYDTRNNETISLEEYIKDQHRWYHEYYKRMVANNIDEKETADRINSLKEFISDNIIRFQQCFEYDTSWKNGEFSDWQRKEITQIYLGFKDSQTYLENKQYKSAFLEFAYFLEVIKRLSTEFVELNNFNLLTFSYDTKGLLTIQKEKFEEKETTFKFAREFNEIRQRNYKKYYAKETSEEND